MGKAVWLLLLALLTCACGAGRPPATPPRVPVQSAYFPVEGPLALDTEAVGLEPWRKASEGAAQGDAAGGASDGYFLTRVGILYLGNGEVDVGPSARGDGGSRADARAQLRERVRREVASRDAPGSRRLELGIDRSVSWAYVSAVLEAIPPPPRDPCSLSLRVRPPAGALPPYAPWPRHMAFVVAAAGAADDAPPIATLEHGAGDSLRVTLAGRAVDVAAGMGLPEVHARLREAVGAMEAVGVVRVRIEEDVTWQQVVYLLDAMHATGTWRIRLGDTPWVLVPRPHVADPPWDPAPDEPLDVWLGLGILLACAVAWRLCFPGAGAGVRRAR